MVSSGPYAIFIGFFLSLLSVPASAGPVELYPDSAVFPARSRADAKELVLYEPLLFRFTHESTHEAFTVGLIRRWRGDADLPLNAHEFAFRMLGHLEREKRKAFADSPGMTPELLAEFDEAEAVADGRSFVAFVADPHDVSRVYAMLRAVGTDAEDPLLPLEKRLGIRLERPPVTIRDVGFSQFFGVTERSGIAYGVPVGGLMELKNLTNLIPSEHDFIPLVIEVLEATGATLSGTEISPRPVQVGWGGVDGRPFTWDRIVPARYVIECDVGRSTYYRRKMGFRELLKTPDRHLRDGLAHILEIERDAFREMGEKLFRARAGFSFATLMKRVKLPDPLGFYRRSLRECRALAGPP